MKFLPRLPMVAVLLLLTLPGAAGAQIYTWRDANGTLVVSDRPLAPDAQTFPVGRSTTVRSTRPAPDLGTAGYDELIERHAQTQGLRTDLVRAVVQTESAFNRWALSPKGAMGLMQLMPATAAELGVSDPYDPEQNVRGGVAYLRHLLDRYAGNEELALAAYNAGPAAVERYGRRVPPFRETQEYVRRIRSKTGLPAGALATRTVYKTVDLVDGREIPRYSNLKPASGGYEVISSAHR